MTLLNKFTIFAVLTCCFSLITIQTNQASASSEKPKEDCTFEAMGFNENSNIAQVYFYTGTCNYRNADYAEAAKYWKKLALLDDVDPEYQELQVTTLNNLGYLMFFGFGIKEDKQEALVYWHKGADLGEVETEYHLCHAYADKEVSTYNPEKGLIHCKKAKPFYDSIEEPDEDLITIRNQINRYLEALQ